MRDFRFVSIIMPTTQKYDNKYNCKLFRYPRFPASNRSRFIVMRPAGRLKVNGSPRVSTLGLSFATFLRFS
jgi:hypothetical protein